jgi:HlyD family secretion protein
MKKLIWIVLILIAAGAGGAVFYANRTEKEPTVTMLKTSRGSIIDAVGATGTLQAVTTVTVGTQVSGIVQSLEGVDFNSIVKKGQIIARLDPSILETQVETAKANLTNANANLERQKVAVADAQSKLKRAKELADRQLINKVDLENAETTVKSSEAQLKSTESSIVQAEASVNKAKVDLDHTVITAPIDGIIIKRSVDRGQTVNAGMSAPELFIIAADLTKMQVNASIDESDVGRMRPGQDVTFRVDAYPLETFHGNVKQVRLNPVTVQNVVTYSTVIDVPNPELKLKPGMTANVSIEIARRDNVLRVPNAALRFRPTKDIFDALNQAMPPELERGGRGGTRGGGANAGNGPGAPTGAGQPASPTGAPAAAPAPSQPSPAAGSQAAAKAPSAERPAPTGGQPKGDRAGGGRNRQQGDQSADAGGSNPGGGRNAGGGNPSAGPGQGGEQGGRGGFGNMTPEEREKRRQEREARLAKMTPEERAVYDQQMKERMAQRGGPGGGGGNFGGRGGQGGNAGNFQRGGGGQAGGGNFGGRGGQSGNTGNFQRNAGGQGGGSNRGQQQSQVADNSKSAATTSATTIDALFAPLPSVETRGRAWLYINKQLKSVSLRLGISDGTFTEVLNDTELQPDVDVVTSIITPEMASRPANQQNNANGNPLMPQRGRGGPGGPGGGGGGGGRGGGR